MAKYSKKAEKKIGKVMEEFKEGKLKSGGSGKTVKSRKQAIAIGISEARAAGAKVPKKSSRRSVGRRSGSDTRASKGSSSKSHRGPSPGSRAGASR